MKTLLVSSCIIPNITSTIILIFTAVMIFILRLSLWSVVWWSLSLLLFYHYKSYCIFFCNSCYYCFCYCYCRYHHPLLLKFLRSQNVPANSHWIPGLRQQRGGQPGGCTGGAVWIWSAWAGFNGGLYTWKSYGKQERTTNGGSIPHLYSWSLHPYTYIFHVPN